MPAELQVLIRHIRRVAGRRELANRSDRELLAVYARERDEDAFTELVRRHAVLVAGVCRRVLRSEQDIEDVFQATFLVLSRKARAVSWHESAANWLHSVAFHLALRARKISLRQQKLERELQLQPTLTSATSSSPKTRELQEVLDQELARLPEACRSALILCYLEGRTRDQAARQSGLSLRTLDRRLELGRQLLRDRLARRGLDLSVVVLAAALCESANAGYANLMSATVQYVMQRASLKVGLANSALKLSNFALSGVSGPSLKIVTGILLTMTVAAAGVSFFSQSAIKARDPALDSNAKKSPLQQLEKASAPPLRLDLFGDSLPEGAVARLGSGRFRLRRPDMIAYAPDGKTLFAGNNQGLTLFEAETGRPIRQVGREWITTDGATAVSPDGKLAAIEGWKGTPCFLIYDTTTGKLLCELQAPDKLGRFDLRGFSPDGALVAAMTYPWRVDLFESRTGKHVRSMEWKFDPINKDYFGDVAFMPDGKVLLASTRGMGIVRLFEVSSGKELGKFTATPNGITGMVLAPDGSRLAILESAAGQLGKDRYPLPGNKVMIVDAQKGRPLTEIHNEKLSRQGMAFTRDSKALFAGEDEGGICTWDVISGTRIGSVPHAYTAEWWRGALALAPDGKMIALGEQAFVQICDMATGREYNSHPGHTAPIDSVALNPINSIVATGGKDGRLLLWDRATSRMLREVCKGTGRVSSVSYSPDGRFLFAIAEFSVEPSHSSIRCWDSASGKEIWRFDDHSVQPGKLSISPDGKVIGALGNTAGLLLEPATGKPIRTLDGEGEETFFHNGWGGLAELGFTPDGSQLLAWGYKNGIHRWDIATGEHRVQTCNSSIRRPYAVAFSPNRKHLIIGGCADHLNLIDVATGKGIRDFNAVSDEIDGTVFGAAFSPDGRTLAWGGPADGIVRFVDVGTGAIRQQLKTLNGRSVPTVFSNDGKSLITADMDGTALVWALK